VDFASLHDEHLAENMFMSVSGWCGQNNFEVIPDEFKSDGEQHLTMCENFDCFGKL
jgi:hypothetical protein